jgi:hypothetical protein
MRLEFERGTEKEIPATTVGELHQMNVWPSSRLRMLYNQQRDNIRVRIERSRGGSR